MIDRLLRRSTSLPLLCLLLALVVASACSNSEPGVEPSSSTAPVANSEVSTSKYEELRDQGKSHTAASELSSLHSAHRAARGLSPSPLDGSTDRDLTTYANAQSTMEAAIVLARFSTTDSREATLREQAAEELKTQFHSRKLDAERALGLLDEIAPEASINERREAANNLARLSRDWDGRDTKEAAEELSRLITGNAVDAEKRIAAANELVSRSNAGDLEANDALDLMHDIRPGVVNQRAQRSRRQPR